MHSLLTLPSQTAGTSTAGKIAPDQAILQTPPGRQAGKLKLLQRPRNGVPGSHSSDAGHPESAATATPGSSAPDGAALTREASPKVRPGRLRILRRGEVPSGSGDTTQQGNSVMPAESGSQSPAQAAAHRQADVSDDEMAYAPQQSREAIRLLAANLTHSPTQLQLDIHSFLWNKFDKLVCSQVQQRRPGIMAMLRKTVQLQVSCPTCTLETSALLLQPCLQLP